MSEILNLKTRGDAAREGTLMAFPSPIAVLDVGISGFGAALDEETGQ